MITTERLDEKTRRCALWLQGRWHAEIEEAIDKARKQSAGNERFRKMWYGAQKNRRRWDGRN